MQSQLEMIEISLSSSPNTPSTPSSPEKRFEQATDAILNYVLGDTVRGADEDEAGVAESSVSRRNQTRTAWARTAAKEEEEEDDGKPHIRFYGVGPSTYQIRCPLCKQRADSETVQMSGILGHLSCLLSTLSCCFPIFSLSFVYLCLQSRLKSKRMFCNRCGGHLGFFWRPT